MSIFDIKDEVENMENLKSERYRGFIIYIRKSLTPTFIFNENNFYYQYYYIRKGVCYSNGWKGKYNINKNKIIESAKSSIDSLITLERNVKKETSEICYGKDIGTSFLI